MRENIHKYREGALLFGVDANLYCFLVREELILSQIFHWAQEHVDHYVIQIRLRTSAPLYDDESGEVAKQAVQEYHLGNELEPGIMCYINRLLTMINSDFICLGYRMKN